MVMGFFSRAKIMGRSKYRAHAYRKKGKVGEGEAVDLSTRHGGVTVRQGC
jgi:hypothetical protein